MKQRKVFAFLLALAVLVGVLPMAAAAIDAPLRRSELVAGLWEAAGSPAPTSAEAPFADVDKNAAYYPAVLWAAETGLTDGTGGGKFSPDAEVSAAQAVAFLWKRAGRPDAAAEIPFANVDASAWYAPAVRWALETGLLDAASGFVPNASVTLAEFEALLASDFLAQLSGSYVELFPAMCEERFVPVWSEVLLPYCSSAEELGQYYQMFTVRFMSELYGAAAVEAYAGDPESAMFNCFFLQDVAQFTIDGNVISGVDAEGRELCQE